MNKKEKLAKSLSVLGIKLGENGKIDENKIIDHLDTVSKSMSDAMSEFDLRLEELAKSGNSDSVAPEMIKKSFSDLNAELSKKFEAIGSIMKSMHADREDSMNTMSEISETVQAVAESNIEMKSVIEGLAEGQLRAGSYTSQGFLQKSFGGEGSPDTKGVRTIPHQNKQAVLQLFDEVEQKLQKSGNAEDVASLSDMAATYEASGVLEPEMHEILTKSANVKFI